jgi:hypothetical protein
MRYLFSIAFSILAFSAHANALNMTCTTDPMTTSVVVFTTGTDTTVRVINHNGVDYLPLSQSIITPHDLAGLVAKATVLKKLGAQYDIHLNSSQCSVNSQKLVSCYGAINQTINGEKITYFSLDTELVSTLSTFSTTPNVQTVATLTLTIGGNDYDFAMDYNAGQCTDPTILAAQK